MIIDSLVPYVTELSEKHGLRYEELAALIDTESSGGRDNNPRLEPGIRDASFGVCQVLTATAVWILDRGLLKDPQTVAILRAAVNATATQGIRALWKAMEEPRVGVALGAAYLSWQRERYGNIQHAVAAYNAGSATRQASGNFSNQSYVDKWNKARQQYEEQDRGSSGITVPSSW